MGTDRVMTVLVATVVAIAHGQPCPGPLFSVVLACGYAETIAPVTTQQQVNAALARLGR